MAGEDDALADRVEELEKENNRLEALFEAHGKRFVALEELIFGGREENAHLPDGPDSWARIDEVTERVGDLQTAMRVVASNVEQIRQAPGEGAGSARVAKIRRSLVRRAKRSGTVSVEQAVQERPAKMDAGEIQTLFGNGISRSYASELVEKAADGEAFWLERQSVPGNPNDKKVLRVDVTELGPDSPYRAVDEEDVELGQIDELLRVDGKLHAEGSDEG